MSVVHYQ